jgi:succinyl-CoA synthetase beta subunit
MKLVEARGKDLFRRFGIPVPEGYLARSPDEVRPPSKPMVMKAQVRSGGRGRAGGIRFASGLDQMKRAVSEMLSMQISGEMVREVLVEERLNILREFYVSLSLDRSSGLPLLLVISQGGMEVEAVESTRTDSWHVHPFVGLQDHTARQAANFLLLDSEQSGQLRKLLNDLWTLFWEMDCELVEVNPLAMTMDGRLIAADSKVVLDDDALFRHPELPLNELGTTPLEIEAKAQGISLVQLEGDIGVIANGAGLTMATLDNLAIRGGKGGVFLDLGGTDDDKVVEGAMELILKARPKAILVNIFGGITRCDTVAEGLIAARRRLRIGIPLVVRVLGVNEAEALELLAAEGVKALYDLDEACAEVVRLKGGDLRDGDRR